MSRRWPFDGAGKPDFFASVHFCHAATHFLLPSWALLFEAMKKGGSLLPFLFGEP
jgi:hypothetical protein